MKDIKNSKNLILIILIVFFVLSVFYLFWSAKRPLQEKWWAIHFENFKGDNVSFVVENHSGKENFRYEIWQGEEKKADQGFQCEKEECLVNITQEKYQERISIKVFLGEDQREIYKNF